MTTYRVRSTDGANADNGSTWALAKLDIAGFAAVDAAGDTAYVSQVHAESTAAAVTWAFAGTIAAPTRVVCGNDGADPPTAVATTATVTTTGSGNFTVTGSLYFYGITITIGTSGTPIIVFGGTNTWQQWENCSFRFGVGTGNAGTIRLGSLTASQTSTIQIWRNCTIKFVNAGSEITINNGFFHWNGGGIEAGSTSPTKLMSIAGTSQAGHRVLLENLDLSAASAGIDLCNSQVLYNDRVTFRNIRVPTSWSGDITAAYSTSAMGRVEAFNIYESSGHINHRMTITDGCGTITAEIALIKAGGASDGTTPISWKMVTNTAVSFPVAHLWGPEIIYWNNDIGVAKTVSIDFLRDSVTGLKDNEIWLEVLYPGSSSTPINSFVTGKAALLASGSTVASSSVGWTTTGMTNPNKQRMSVTFTPQVVGNWVIKICLAKASTTLYADPSPVVV